VQRARPGGTRHEVDERRQVVEEGGGRRRCADVALAVRRPLTCARIPRMLRRHAGLLLCALAGASIMAAVSYWVLDSEADVSVLRGAFTALGIMVEPLLTRRRARTQDARGRFDVAVRLVSGRQGGVDRGWRSASVEPGPGTLRLTPLHGGLRFLRGTPVVLHVEAARLTTERTRARDMMRTFAGLPIVEVRTGSGVVHLAVPYGNEQRVVDLATAPAA
jgi:hypothetical protein